mgnify:CR=1 FL=1
MPSVQTILTTPAPTLAVNSVKIGREVVVGAINLLVADFLEFVGKKLTETQERLVSEMILEMYPNYHMDTVRLCLFRIASGRYGTIYGDVNGMVVMEFFKKFDLELDEEIHLIRSKESDVHKKGIASILNIQTDDEKKAEAFRLMKEDLIKIGKEKEIKKTYGIQFGISETEQVMTGQKNKKTSGSIIQQWLREFDELYKSTGIPSHQTKTVEYCEIRLNQLEFLEMKQKEFNNQ